MLWHTTLEAATVRYRELSDEAKLGFQFTMIIPASGIDLPPDCLQSPGLTVGAGMLTDRWSMTSLSYKG
jgi:hypothetical protein